MWNLSFTSHLMHLEHNLTNCRVKKVNGKWSARQAELICGSLAVSQTPETGKHEREPNALRRVIVYLPAFAGTKVYCLMTEAAGH